MLDSCEETLAKRVEPLAYLRLKSIVYLSLVLKVRCEARACSGAGRFKGRFLMSCFNIIWIC